MTNDLDRMNDDALNAADFEQDGAGESNAADNFFFCVFVIAMAFMIAHEGWYAPGL